MAVSKLHLAFGDMEREFAVLREMLSRVPDDKFDWKPHEKSWTMGQLSCHLVDLLWWQVCTPEMDGIDMSKKWDKTEASTQAELLEAFDTKATQLREVFARTTEKTLDEPWTLSYAGTEYFTMPKADVLRMYGISHIAHHRGQLTVYLRLNDVPLPPSYGPSADER